MRSNKFFISIGAISFLFSFIYGVTTVQYKIFPYEQLKSIKNIIKPATNQNTKYSAKFYHRKSFFEQHGNHDCDIVFIGDSITEGAEWQELFPSLKIANRGIGGDRTDGILKRMDSIYSTNAPKAFIMVGINDFSAKHSVKEVIQNYDAIIAGLLDKKMEIYVQSTILAGERRQELNTKILNLNRHLSKLAQNNSHIHYVDLNSQLSNSQLLKSKYSLDDVHLNGDGYQIWKNIIKPYIES